MQPKLVYLIDDDNFLLDMYVLKLKECGLPIEAISDAAIALEKIRHGAQPDIIMVDIIMPGMNGFDFIDTLKKEGLAKDALIIVLSNQGQQEDLDRAKALNVAGYIIKASAIPSEVCDKVLAISGAKPVIK